MMSKTHDDARLFEALVCHEAPEVDLRPSRMRSGAEVLDLIYQGIVVAANFGGFLGLVTACRSFLKQRPRYEVELSYLDQQGARRSSTYTGATVDQMEEVLRLHMPNTSDGVRLRIRDGSADKDAKRG